MDFCLHCHLTCCCDPDGVTLIVKCMVITVLPVKHHTKIWIFPFFGKAIARKMLSKKGEKKKSNYAPLRFSRVPSWRSPETRILIRLQIYYMSVTCTSVLKIKPSWKSVVFTIKVRKNFLYFVGLFNTTIIPLALVGYEMIIANSALRASFAIYHLISKTHMWNNC